MEIPVEFEYEGKKEKGILSSVSGAGSDQHSNFHLMVNNYYWGELVHREGEEWVFHSPTKDLQHLANYFGSIVMLWYE